MPIKRDSIIREIKAHPRTSNKTLSRKYKVTTTYVQRLRRNYNLPSPNGFRNRAPKDKQFQLNLQPRVEKPTQEEMNALAHKLTQGRQAARAAQATHDLDAILEERGEQYGEFMANADVTIKIKQVLHRRIADRNLHLYPDQLLALDMIVTKLGRIVSGNYNHVDSWKDIAGYAKLVADRLEGKSR